MRSLLKISATYVRSQLTHICNKAILSGIFPDYEVFNYKTHISERKENESNKL